MKKSLLAGLLLTGILGISAYGQYPQQDRQENRHRTQTWERYDDRTQTKTEYRYVEYRGDVYRETYRTTYRKNGYVINRVLVRRELVSTRGRRHGFRLNVFIPFK